VDIDNSSSGQVHSFAWTTNGLSVIRFDADISGGGQGSGTLSMGISNLRVVDEFNTQMPISPQQNPVPCVNIKNCWKNTFLVDNGDTLTCQSGPVSDDRGLWYIEDHGDYVRIRNKGTND
jgi:hypothetical protein